MPSCFRVFQCNFECCKVSVGWLQPRKQLYAKESSNPDSEPFLGGKSTKIKQPKQIEKEMH